MAASLRSRAGSCSPDGLPLASSPSPLSTITRVWNDRLRALSSPRDVSTVGELDNVIDATPTVKGEGRLRQVAVVSSGGGRLEAASGVDDGLTDSPAATVRTRTSSLYAARTSSKRRALLKWKDATAVSPRSSSVITARRPVDPNAEGVVNFAKPLFPNTLLTEAQDERRLLTLVLDLDETLVSNRDSRHSSAVLRPYCLHVLNALRHMKELEIVLWTASTKETASPVVQQLHKTGIIFDDTIYRNNIWFTQPIHTKDLRLLGRNMDRVLIVDNSVGCCKLHPRNSLLVEDFHGVRRRDDAALVNVYYVVDALLRMMRERSMSVSEGLGCLIAEGQLCHMVNYDLPELFKYIPLTEVPELKRPPVGRFVRANTAPPNTSIMQHWVY
ncbi:NLI interacting factor-like phosphatase, putative [Leishmania lindenbergi]|uniref:Mitochondrial import inner membrane translocase subunit TIM50 n=1 Tax=Leishmania lindenbergi TaxID=651832 RepID=A0AAW3AF50_9TRYP